MSSLDLAAAIGQFARQAAALKAVFSPRQLARLAGGLARLGRQHAFFKDRLGFFGILLKETTPSFSFTACCTNDSTSGFSSLSFVWLSNCGSGSLTLMIATNPSRTSSPLGRMSFIRFFGLGIPIDRAGQGGLKPAQMRAAVVVVDVVGEGQQRFVVPVVILHRDFDDQPARGVFLR